MYRFMYVSVYLCIAYLRCRFYRCLGIGDVSQCCHLYAPNDGSSV